MVWYMGIAYNVCIYVIFFTVIQLTLNGYAKVLLLFYAFGYIEKFYIVQFKNIL